MNKLSSQTYSRRFSLRALMAAAALMVLAAQTLAQTPSGPVPVTPPMPSDGRVEALPTREKPAYTLPPGVNPVCTSPGPRMILGVDCDNCPNCGELGWKATGPVAWQYYAQGEYVGMARTPHVPEYRLRVDDSLECIYQVTRDPTVRPYELQVGDEVELQSFADEHLSRTLIVLPDGTVAARLLGTVPAAGLTVTQLRENLDERYKKYYKVPAITITPLKVNTRLEDLRLTVVSGFGNSGQSRQARVAPDGSITLTAFPHIPVQGLTLTELKREVDERYNVHYPGMAVTPQLLARATRYVYVVGEVRNPGRFVLEAPTTTMQAIALAGGWNVGANLNQVVVFRRGEDWQLLATMLDIRGALYGKSPCPADEIWLSDSDIVVVPKSPILVADDFINLVFTRGLYGVLPGQSTAISFTRLGSL